ncbi:MAG: hypothetical protein JSW51_06425 [Gemmatimonadota bacterium]|nr:MAG: hypothetical protein JSW51_06425 [Gemmatimonadota bacterium]
MGSLVAGSASDETQPSEISPVQQDVVEVGTRTGLSPRSVLLGGLSTIAVLGIALIVLLVASLISIFLSDSGDRLGT